MSTTLDTPLDELQISVRSFMGLERAGCRTLRDVLRLSLYDLSLAGLSRLARAEVVHALRSAVTQEELLPFLGRESFTLPLPPTKPPASDVNALYVIVDVDVDTDQQLLCVRQAVADTYAAAGFLPTATLDDDDAEDHGDHEPVERAALVPDETAVVPGAAVWHVGVVTRRLVRTPVGRHPLALGLSQRFDVIATQCRAGGLSELAVYRGGKLDQCHVVDGDPASGAPLSAARLSAAGLSPAWLSDQCGVPNEILRSCLPNAELLRRVASLDLESFDDTPLDAGDITRFAPAR